MNPEGSDIVAAVDLGSNSFHLLVAQATGGQVQVVDRLRERVALAAGLDRRGALTPQAQDRALVALERMGQRLRGMDGSRVRVVGTNTFRQARNADAFVEEAEAALGFPIEIISGREEARLIYLGVFQELPVLQEPRLVIDIGGGSTECIVGQGSTIVDAHSLHMGCVSFQRFFPDGQVTAEHMEAAVMAASLELQPIEQLLRQYGWKEAVGSSGTVTSMELIQRANGWTDDGITRKGLRRVVRAIVEAGRVDDIQLDGMARERSTVLPGGVAILQALFERLNIDRLQVSKGAMREGIVDDLLGRLHHRDVRDETVRGLQVRYGVDVTQAQRVEDTAAELLGQVAVDWDLTDASCALFLRWACRLHEIGKAVAFSGYHKHGGYLVRFGDLAGFSLTGRQVVGELVRQHRRKFRVDRFSELPARWGKPALRLTLLMRLAVLLRRARDGSDLPPVRLQVRKRDLGLEFPPQWLDDHPLTVADLRREAEFLSMGGLSLRWVS